MPFTEPTPAGSGDTTAPGADACGGMTTAGALPLDAPLGHMPGNRVGVVPQGQPSADAGAATTNGAKANATAHPKIRIPRFRATITLPTTHPARVHPSLAQGRSRLSVGCELLVNDGDEPVDVG